MSNAMLKSNCCLLYKLIEDVNLVKIVKSITVININNQNYIMLKYLLSN